MTQRRCFACDLVDDPAAIAEYRAWHAPGGPPPGVLDRLRERGITSLQIWLTGHRLLMVMDVEEGAALRASDDSQHPEDVAWEAQMSAYQRPLPWATGVKWVPMDLIFELPD